VDKKIPTRAKPSFFGAPERLAACAGIRLSCAGPGRVLCEDDRMLRLPSVNFLYMGSFFTLQKLGMQS
jgi:hypothetical protein